MLADDAAAVIRALSLEKSAVAELNIDFLAPTFAAAPQVRWHGVLSRIECPILLLTGDPELGAIVTPEVTQEATQLWKHGEVHISAVLVTTSTVIAMMKR